jgi:hypothetical protein
MDLRQRPEPIASACRRVAGSRLAATSITGALLLTLAGSAVPAALAKEETAAPATRVLDVRVTFENKSVEGASVVAIDGESHIQALTDHDGKAQLRLSADGKVNGIVALDPQRGVGGRWSRARKLSVPLGAVVPISLEPAKPHTFRVVDTEGKPVRLVPLVVSAYRTWTSGWVPPGAFEAAHLHTDARGEAVAAWLPRDLSQVEVETFDDRWAVAEVDSAKTAQGITRVKVCRLRAVEGRLSMPGDASPEGLLIAGLGSTTTSLVHETSARVRRDGKFTVYLADGYGYWLGVIDSQWASDPWIGDVDDPIQLVAYSAPALTVRVTRGPKHEPVAGASLAIAGTQDAVLWEQARSQTRLGSNGPFAQLYTDRDGRARIAVCKGLHAIWMEAGDWQENQTLEVAAGKPAAVEFYRPWADKRTITGRLLVKGNPHASGPATRVRAWNVKNPEVAAEGVLERDGRFTVKIDAPDVYLLALDSQNRLGAAERVSEKHLTANLELVRTASLSGVVVDSAGKPLAGHAVEALPTQKTGNLGVGVMIGMNQNGKMLPDNMGAVIVDGGDFGMGSVVLQSAACDAQGRFKVDLVPAQIPVRVVTGTPAEARASQFSTSFGRFRVDSSQDVYLEPGEARDNVRLVARGEAPPTQTPEQDIPHEFEQSFKRAKDNAAREGLRMLVILVGEPPKGGTDVSDSIIREDVSSAISRYELLFFSPEEVRSHGALLTRLGWERPQAEELELIVLDATGAKIAAERFKADGTAAPGRRASKFIRRHAPPARDAQALLRAAQGEAKKSGRRLWIVETSMGMMCPHCNDLACWLDAQRALLTKDYVVLRIGPYHDHSQEVLEKFQSQDNSAQNQDRGPPWFAIAEPDGKVLVTSLGPLGNIGLPSSIEEKRHFKAMITRTARRLTPAECDRLIESLPKPSP